MAVQIGGQTKISIHAPREGERLAAFLETIREIIFQSTLPARGSDSVTQRSLFIVPIFQSTLPARGSDTLMGELDTMYASISIHAPREGERPRAMLLNLLMWNFNPRSPRGGATAEKCICMQHFREFTEYYPLRHGDACCIAPQDCIIQAFFGAKKRCFYVRLCFALKNKGVRG